MSNALSSPSESPEEREERLFQDAFDKYGELAIHLNLDQLEKLAYGRGWRIDVDEHGAWSIPYCLVEDGEERLLLAELLENDISCTTDEQGRVTFVSLGVDEESAPAADQLALAAPLRFVETLYYRGILEVPGKSLDGDGLQHLRNWDSLQVIEITANPILAGDGFEELCRYNPLPQLREFECHFIRAADRIASALLRATGLQRLDLSHTDLTDASLPEIAKFPELKAVIMDRTAVTLESLAAVGKELPWEKVNLQDSPSVTDDGVRELALRAPHLRELWLGSPQITDRAVESLARCSELATLCLAQAQITPDCLEHLAALPKLKSLVIAETPLGDESIPTLKQMTTLTYLDTHVCRITKNGIRRLRRALPSCTIG